MPIFSLQDHEDSIVFLCLQIDSQSPNDSASQRQVSQKRYITQLLDYL